MKPGNPPFHRFRWLFPGWIPIFIRKIFRPSRFSKYEVAPRLNVPAVERRILQKIRSPQDPPVANH
jgi:hypothetical protein